MTTVHFLRLSLEETQCGSLYSHTTVSLGTPDVCVFHPTSNFPAPNRVPCNSIWFWYDFPGAKHHIPQVKGSVLQDGPHSRH